MYMNVRNKKRNIYQDNIARPGKIMSKTIHFKVTLVVGRIMSPSYLPPPTPTKMSRSQSL